MKQKLHKMNALQQEKMLQRWIHLVDLYNQCIHSPSAKKWLDLLWELFKVFLGVLFRKILDQLWR